MIMRRSYLFVRRCVAMFRLVPMRLRCYAWMSLLVVSMVSTRAMRLRMGCLFSMS